MINVRYVLHTSGSLLTPSMSAQAATEAELIAFDTVKTVKLNRYGALPIIPHGVFMSGMWFDVARTMCNGPLCEQVDLLLKTSNPIRVADHDALVVSLKLDGWSDAY